MWSLLSRFPFPRNFAPHFFQQLNASINQSELHLAMNSSKVGKIRSFIFVKQMGQFSMYLSKFVINQHF